MAAKGSCLYQGVVRYHGDVWNNTGCEFCSCSRGQVTCQRAECARLDCPRVSAHQSDVTASFGTLSYFETPTLLSFRDLSRVTPRSGAARGVPPPSLRASLKEKLTRCSSTLKESEVGPVRGSRSIGAERNPNLRRREGEGGLQSDGVRA